MSGTLTVGALVGFNLFAARIAQPVLRLAQCWQELQQARVSLRHLDGLMRATPESAVSSTLAQRSPLAGQIVFESVQFRYRPQGPEILRGLSFECRPGAVLALVGPSGSGKSTIAGLLQRLNVPQGGRILLDGQNLAVLDPQWLRRQIGVVLQENSLFNRSVRENIARREPGLPMATIVAAAQLAGAHDFILALPEGYDTQVGEQGVGLSGGQRQRIALARALVTNPRLLILDEATSALDYETETLINQNLRQIARGRTVLLIAHRLSAVCRADRILVLDEGQIVEQGTHPELVARGGAYARLWALQALAALEARGRATRADFTQRWQTELATVEERTLALEAALVKAHAHRERLTFYAPVAGRVFGFSVHAAGAVVNPAEVLMQIVPTAEPLAIEVLVENRDRGFIRPGRAARIKVDAFNFTRYGTLEGVVRDIAADAQPSTNRAQYFAVRIVPASDRLRVDGRWQRLMSGMSVTVDFELGTRRAIDFLPTPLRRYRAESAREP